MPCYAPLDAWRSNLVFPSGKVGITFDRKKAPQPDVKLQLPCGQCIGCRLERSRQWAIRCLHEAQLHEDNCFITLTYAPEHLPSDLSLNKKHFTDFMKRLRKDMPVICRWMTRQKDGSIKTKNQRKPVRYYHCGEYGEENQRPHYHAILFGHDFEDKLYWKKSYSGEPLYVSEKLNNLWGKGHCYIGSVTMESAAYVARYIMKKTNGEALDQVDAETGLKPYELIDPETGDIIKRQQEYTTMSLKPGIGTKWYEKYAGDVFPHDNVVVNGRVMRPPKFYDKCLERSHSEGFDLLEKLKTRRKLEAEKHADNQTPERLRVIERCKQTQIRSLERKL